MKNLRDGDRWHTPCLFRPQTKVVDHFEGVTRIRKTVGISLLILVCVAALSAPVAAHHSAGLVVTNPTTLVVLGAALINLGVWTRRLFSRQKRER